MEVLLVVLGALIPQFASDIANGIGQFASQKWRNFVKEINAAIAKNNQLLSDWKTKSESQKAYAINALINSSGLGARAASLRKEIKKVEDEDASLTKEVTDKNIALTNELNRADQQINNANTGLIGAGESYLRGNSEADPSRLEQYKVQVQSPSQNVDGGLQGGHD